MKKMMWATLFACLYFATLLAGSDPKATAKTYLESFFKRDFETMWTLQDETMRRVFGKQAMEQSSKTIEVAFGAFEAILSIEESEVQGYHVFLFYTKMQKSYAQITVSVDSQNLVAGFYAKPAPSPSALTPPYADTQRFTEEEVVFGSEQWPVYGALTLPKIDAPYPLVILVGGSGPTDRDSTIGPNKPFRDLAYGLSSAGVAVLRYDKRPATHGERMLLSETSERGAVWDEYLEDLEAAIAYASELESIGPIYLAGHSLGGQAAAYVAIESECLSGLILLAAPARRFAQISIDQNRYFFSSSGLPQEQLDAVVSFFQSVLNRELPPEIEIQPGLTVGYLYDWDRYQTMDSLEKVRLPVIALQGEEDFQATMDGDFLPLKEAFGDSSRFTFKSFPGLNHLFMRTETDVFHTVDEYQTEGFVAYDPTFDRFWRKREKIRKNNA
ncbi:MAG TPA: alpha/beta fold hydrolase, partial [Thermotogota bacterium]|nr:alpha/beta fold hydrolase [Thermotogota bacterium]